MKIMDEVLCQRKLTDWPLRDPDIKYFTDESSSARWYPTDRIYRSDIRFCGNVSASGHWNLSPEDRANNFLLTRDKTKNKKNLPSTLIPNMPLQNYMPMGLYSGKEAF